MRVAIVGSRIFSEQSRVVAYVKGLPAGTTVVSGGASGVDTIAENAARAAGLPVIVFKADWERHGKSAGFIRNRAIAEACDRMVAFWDGSSRGTRHSISIARRAGKPVEVILSTNVGGLIFQ